MNSIIIDLVEYVENNTVSDPLAPVIVKIGALEVRQVGIKLLSWLKVSARVRKPTALVLNQQYPWCQDVLVLLSHFAQLAELFEVTETLVDFKSTVPTNERNELCTYVNDHYHPKLRT